MALNVAFVALFDCDELQTPMHDPLYLSTNRRSWKYACVMSIPLYSDLTIDSHDQHVTNSPVQVKLPLSSNFEEWWLTMSPGTHVTEWKTIVAEICFRCNHLWQSSKLNHNDVFFSNQFEDVDMCVKYWNCTALYFWYNTSSL